MVDKKNLEIKLKEALKENERYRQELARVMQEKVDTSKKVNLAEYECGEWKASFRELQDIQRH